MEDLRPESLQTVATRVVAWHNRHPLARRVTAEQVQSVGYVALPYLAPGQKDSPSDSPRPAADATEAPAGGSLRERALARAKQAAGDENGPPPRPDRPLHRLKAAFTEDFIAPLSPRRVARWAAQHGVAQARPPSGAPLKQVEPDAAFAGKTRELLTLYVMTAMVESRGQRVRMLLGPGSGKAVLGKRLWSPPRLAAGAVAALGTVATLGLALALLWQTPPSPAPVAMAHTGAVTDAVTSHAEPPAPAALPPSIKPPSMRAAALADAGLADDATAAASAASAAQARPHAEPPPDAQPTLGRVNLPALGLPRGDAGVTAARERRLAQRGGAASAALPAMGLAASAAAPLIVAAQPAPAASKPALAAPPAPAPAPASAFALSSRRLRTRAESEQTMAAVQSLLVAAGHQGIQVEVVPTGEDWRVVSWPFGQRNQAEKARTLLASRGIRLEVVDF